MIRSALIAALVGFVVGFFVWIAAALVLLLNFYIPMVWGIAAGVAMAVLFTAIDIATNDRE